MYSPTNHETEPHRGKAWITWLVINGLIVFFGTSYLFFPGEDVVAAGHRTEGVLQVPAEVWGTYVIVSATAMLLVTWVGLRAARSWAIKVAGYEFIFLLSVAAIEPDPVFPTIFAAVLAFALWRVHRSSADQIGPGAEPSAARSLV